MVAKQVHAPHEPAPGPAGSIGGHITSPQHTHVIAATTQWLERAVIGLNLCPFAKAVYTRRQIRFVVSAAADAEDLREDLVRELGLLVESPAADIETTLLIHPGVLNDFFEYNYFLGQANAALAALDLRDEFQIASFHPHYQFAGTAPDAIDNYTNRSPYPMLHLLREASITRGLAAFPEAATIFEGNVAALRRLGHEGWAKLMVSAEPTVPPAAHSKS
ncbi:MAG: hypothetical protein RLZZ227_45 [Pseudomonadota bacterium]